MKNIIYKGIQQRQAGMTRLPLQGDWHSHFPHIHKALQTAVATE